MGVSKRGPIIEARDRLLLEFTDGSACESDGLKLTYTTRIHLVCSRGSEVSRVEFSTFAPGAPHVSDAVCVALFAVDDAAVPDVPQLHCQLQVGDQGSLRHHHHQEHCEFTSGTLSI